MMAFDHRDFPYTGTGKSIPSESNGWVRAAFPKPNYDQLKEGSCTANSYSKNQQIEEIRYLSKTSRISMLDAKSKVKDLSRQFFYHNELIILNGNASNDTGADKRTMAKTGQKIGICLEGLWGYGAHRFSENPSSICFQNAQDHKISRYEFPKSLDDIKDAINNRHKAVSIGIPVHKSFMTKKVATTGLVPLPTGGFFGRWIDPIEGGHELIITHYDDTQEVDGCIGAFWVENSWSSNWGINGGCWIPYRYFEQEGGDYLVIYFKED
jgi:hypothetical protein